MQPRPKNHFKLRMFQFNSAMTIGTRTHRQTQKDLWCGSGLPEAPSYPFYQGLNKLLANADFDEFCLMQT